MTPPRNLSNLFLVLGLLFALALLGYFFAAVFGAKEWGEVAAALGGLIGGLIGASGAIWAVFLTLARQRQEEMAKVASAVRTEVIALVTYIIGAIETCMRVRNDATFRMPRVDAIYIVKNLLTDPVVYPAVADRVGVLPHPSATAAFYMRIAEAKVMTEMFARATGTTVGPFVTPEFAATVADSLLTALHLALPIVADAPAQSDNLTALVRDTMIDHMRQCDLAARAVFPDAESFQGPQPAQPAWPQACGGPEASRNAFEPDIDP